jgi:signal transduction histidine kinase/DNA-binding NarL/FixJ family response regulator
MMAQADSATSGGHGRAAPRGRLSRKYLAAFVGIVSAALVINGTIDAWFSYQEQKRLLIGIQREQADAAAAKISQFVGEVERQLGWLAQLPSGAITREDLRIDAIRLLRLTPAIAEVAQADAAGREQFRVSRHAIDSVGSGHDLSGTTAFRGAKQNGSYYGPVYFFRETEPFMTLAIAGPGREPAISIAEVNLRFIWDLVSQIKVGASGKAYVTDGRGRLIAHPDLWPVLRNTDLAGAAQVRSALSGAAPGESGEVADDLAGRRVLSTYASVRPLSWFVFVELPVDEAYASIYASIVRAALLLVGLLACAILAALFLSRRMTVPIEALTRGAARIGSGDLEQRLAIRTGDELEALGEQFNQMASQLSESYATLERKVIERTAELAQARDQAWEEHAGAQRARQAAEQANEAKSRFLAVISHELRTPLNGVIGVLQLLDNGQLDETQRRQLQVAAASGDTLLALIDAILEYARLEAGTETLERRNFRPNQLIASAVDLMRPQAEARGLTLTLAAGADVAVPVNGDPVRLNRVLLNLLGNAVKFTATGGITVEASAVPADAHTMLRVAVRDTGIGIAPAMHERIFEDFVQADDSIARRFGGSGLGLAISRRLARLMGGELIVESAPGAGSTFRLAVLLAPAAETAPPIDAVAPSAPLAVLLVDDEPVNRDIGAALLRRLGHVPTVAADGSSAVALARTGAFDAVLMDLHMPDMDGIEAAEEIRALPLAPMPRIIMLTADMSERSRARIAGAGIEAIVSKPILLDALRAALARPADGAIVPPPAVPAPDTLIDDDFLTNQRLLLGPTRLRDLGRLLEETSATLLRQMEEAAARADGVAVGRAAHRLGSAASALALARLFASCNAVETDAASMSPEALREAVAELAALREASVAALDARLRASETALAALV